jgi:hypothetical protein
MEGSGQSLPSSEPQPTDRQPTDPRMEGDGNRGMWVPQSELDEKKRLEIEENELLRLASENKLLKEVERELQTPGESQDSNRGRVTQNPPSLENHGTPLSPGRENHAKFSASPIHAQPQSNAQHAIEVEKKREEMRSLRAELSIMMQGVDQQESILDEQEQQNETGGEVEFRKKVRERVSKRHAEEDAGAGTGLITSQMVYKHDPQTIVDANPAWFQDGNPMPTKQSRLGVWQHTPGPLVHHAPQRTLTKEKVETKKMGGKRVDGTSDGQNDTQRNPAERSQGRAQQAG